VTRFDVPVVVGTGPSGIACAHALIERGIRPVMLDGGGSPGQEALARSRVADLPSVVEGAAGSTASRNNPAEKTWFGSSFATTPHPSSPLGYETGLTARASYAVGGLSRIWGGTFTFFRGLDDWPSAIRPAQADLDAVRALVPSSTTDLSGADQLTEGTVPGSESAARAMRRFSEASDGTWEVEASQVAIDSRLASRRRCVLLGTCLDGCAADALWYAGDTVRDWAESGLVTHLSGVVNAVEEEEGRVILRMADGSAAESIEAPRVYIAAGALSTGALLVRSGIARQLVLRDTATAFGAALQIRAGGDRRPHHGLSQWWARNADSTFLAQVYPPYAGNAQRLAARIGFLAKAPGALDRLARRLHPVIAYLGAEFSDRITVSADGDRVVVRGQLSEASRDEFRARMASFSSILRHAGYLLPVFVTEFSMPGTGYHFGASLPHGNGTDSLGRPSGMARLHIVDSTVLPQLEVGSITPTVMANAIRVGRESGDLLPAP
jgi:hypothetical protein